MLSPEAALATWFPNIECFRDQQREAVVRLMSDRSVLMLMPTGGGKSLTYQLPVLASSGVGLIVSPLVALMRQQAQRLSELGANALSLGGVEATEAQEALRKFRWDLGPAFLFISPERAEADGYLEHLLRKHRARLTLIAIDEAHCVSQWGHDFRPPYKALPGFFDRAFGRGAWPPVVCLSATMDSLSEAEIRHDFRLVPADTLRSRQMLRTNLELSFERYANTEEKLGALTTRLENSRSKKIIVYTHLKQNKTAGTRALTERFASLGHRCAAFDADLPMDDSHRVMESFKDGEIDVVFATGAFGMGIDIPDIRGVIHFLLPESLEQYYQEVGRAGRDGAPAFGLLLYAPKNATVREDLIKQGIRNTEQIMETWSSLIGANTGKMLSISPYTAFQDRADDYALFYAFQRTGAVEVLARGPGRLASFEPRGPEGAAFLNHLASGTRTGSLVFAIRNLGLNPGETYERLFDLYSRGEVRLVRSPDNTLLFKARDLEADEVQGIEDEIRAKVEKRLVDFRSFTDLIERCDFPSVALAERFGR